MYQLHFQIKQWTIDKKTNNAIADILPSTRLWNIFTAVFYWISLIFNSRTSDVNAPCRQAIRKNQVYSILTIVPHNLFSVSHVNGVAVIWQIMFQWGSGVSNPSVSFLLIGSSSPSNNTPWPPRYFAVGITSTGNSASKLLLTASHFHHGSPSHDFSGSCHSACNTHHCCSFVPECNTLGYAKIHASPDSKIHGANMRPTWGRLDPGGPHVGPMNLAIWGHLKQMVSLFQVQGLYWWITGLRVIPVTQWRQLLQRTVVLNRE